MQRHNIRRFTAAIAVAALGLVAAAAPASAQSSFPDVPPDSFFGPAVEWMEEQGITDGIGDTGLYKPHEVVNRAQLATFMWRMAGEPGGNPDHGFTDVPEGSFYDEAVKWLKDQDITTGIGGGNEFKPLDPVIRSQAFTFLWRYGGEPLGDPVYEDHGFTDVPEGSFYELAARWAKAEGITTGIGGSQSNPSTTFGPDIDLTRGQMAAMIWRYAGFPAPDEPGNTQPGAFVPSMPDIVDAEMSALNVVTITYSEAVTCTDNVETAAQFTVTDVADRTGASITCDGTATVAVTLDAPTVSAEKVDYAEGDADDRIKSLDGVDAKSPDTFEFAA